MNKKKNLLAIIGVVIVTTALLFYYTGINPENAESSYGDVTVTQAKALIESKPNLIILDVRTQEEYDAGHIENAILIPVSDLIDRLDELSKEKEILVYCRTGNRSSNAVNTLRKNGYTKIFHMVDGITGWIQAGYPIVK